MKPTDYQIFISHSGLDTWVAKQIEAHARNAGASTFLDDSDIDVGDDFEAIILKELQKSEELLVLFTPWSLKRPYVWMEIGAAWGLQKRIIFVLHGTKPEDLSAEGSIPALVKKSNLITLNQLDRYFAELKERLNTEEVE
ncbi:MAG TPA: toll/interleukin-1 receptor domain-containing protein [Pyrinomonadaceae bacterium]|nr:toll/interleukin-1 receptor domain-containing protein [Pyrinomonadaceae bacterium]